MGEYLSPGVFMEEVPSTINVVQAVSTSNVGAVGFTTKGPTDTATLVTSYEQFTKVFGGPTRDSLLPLSMAAFFSNGGRRAYIVRVMPSDATAADAKIISQQYDQKIEDGTGALNEYSKLHNTSLLKDNDGATPIVPGSLTLKWRAAGTPVSGGNTYQRDGTTALVLVPAQASYEGRLVTSLPSSDPALHAVVPGTITIKFTTATVPGPGVVNSIVIPAPTGTSFISVGTVGTSPNIATATLDHSNGYFTLKMEGSRIPVSGDTGNVTADYTPASATKVVTETSHTGATVPYGDLAGTGVIDGTYVTNVPDTGYGNDGTGNNILPNTVIYGTGGYNFRVLTAAVPHNYARVLATYQIEAWDLNPISKGSWANDLRVVVSGSPSYYDPLTQSYTNFDVSVQMLDDIGNWQVLETYDELDFADATAASYFPDVINELSDYITVTEPGADEAPNSLVGISYSYALGGDDGSSNKVFGITPTISLYTGSSTVGKRSVVVTYTKATDSTTATITDDGKGNLTGSIDTTGTNTITYSTGAIKFKTAVAIKPGTLVTVSYTLAPAETSRTEQFGDTTKDYTEGSDGTFTSTYFSRSQFTDPTLEANYQGVYALNRIDELMQVIVPDFAGDTTVSQDLLTYANSRATSPSGGDRFIILVVPKGSGPQDAVDWFRYQLGQYSNFAALYWPWVKVADPLSNNRPVVFPPLGHIAGIYARTDATRNVGKSPGGTVDGALNFITGLEYISTLGERDLVYPNKINPLIDSAQTGRAVWGVRTISQVSDWRYINARRLFMFIEKSVFNSTHWVVFENNGPSLWARITAQVGGFLNSLYNDGYFAGSNPSQAYYVVCNESNNTADSINQGQVIVDVGIAPNKPAEFVRFRLTQIQAS